MRLFTIFKEDNELKFAIDTPFVPNRFDKLKYLNLGETSLQVVKGKNQTYNIIYNYSFSGVNGSRCLDFYKMTLQDVLSKGNTLDFLYLSTKVIPELKKSAEKCFSLRISEGVAFTPVDVYIFNENQGFSITTNFYVEEILNVDSGALNFEAIREAKNLNFKDYTNKLIELNDKTGFGFSYPLIIGSSKNDNVTILDKDGRTRIVNKEEFICHW